MASANLRLEADLAKTKLALHRAKTKVSKQQTQPSYASVVAKGLLTQPPLMNLASQSTPIPVSQPTSATPLTQTVPPMPDPAMQHFAEQIAAAIVAALRH